MRNEKENLGMRLSIGVRIPAQARLPWVREVVVVPEYIVGVIT